MTRVSEYSANQGLKLEESRELKNISSDSFGDYQKAKKAQLRRFANKSSLWSKFFK